MPIAQAAGRYLQEMKALACQPLDQRTDRNGSGETRLRSVRISMGGDSPPGVLAAGRPAEFEFELTEAKSRIDLSFTIFDNLGNPVSNFDTHRAGPQDRRHSEMAGRLTCRIEELPLVPGSYRINAMVRMNRAVVDHVEGAALFDVETGMIGGRPSGGYDTWGRVSIVHAWAMEGRDKACP
jgi:lipopolysaccharide transport system ATP-binding protein